MHAPTRPYWEPPLFDYRRYEKDGDMYWLLHKHLTTLLSVEEWYGQNDIEIDEDLLREYLRWSSECMRKAEKEGVAEKAPSYRGLSSAIAKDHSDAGWELFKGRVERFVIDDLLP